MARKSAALKLFGAAFLVLILSGAVYEKVGERPVPAGTYGPIFSPKLRSSRARAGSTERVSDGVTTVHIRAAAPTCRGICTAYCSGRVSSLRT